jgi:hypothetical protein
MCCNFICSCNSICFLKFVVHEMNSEIVKSRMVVLTGRENADTTLLLFGPTGQNGWMTKMHLTIKSNG